MANCYYEGCDRQPMPGRTSCILHQADVVKDPAQFNLAVQIECRKPAPNLRHVWFPSEYKFQNVLFGGCPDFTGTTFMGDISFQKVALDSGAVFNNTTFHGKASFEEIEADGDVYFIGAKFEKEANFKKAQLEDVHFSKAIFFSMAVFDSASFNGHSLFKETTFHGTASFIGALFCSDTNFSEAVFQNAAEFNISRFENGDVLFNYAKFQGMANFQLVKANSNISFLKVEFGGETRFEWAELKDATFLEVTFRGQVFFMSTLIAQRAAFAGSTFVENALFQGRGDDSGAKPIFENCEVDFRYIDIRKQLKIELADFSKCQFSGNDLDPVELISIQWPKKETPRLAFRRHVVYEEIREDRIAADWYFSSVEQYYRNLKCYYEARKDYGYVGDFHYGEMEMKRRDRSGRTGPLTRLILTIYWGISGYGERLGLPLFWAGLLLILGCVLYLSSGIAARSSTQSSPASPIAIHRTYIEQDSSVVDTLFLLHTQNIPEGRLLSVSSPADWFRTLPYSFGNMVLLKPDELVILGQTGIYVRVIQNVMGPIFFGLFALALRQRLKR